MRLIVWTREKCSAARLFAGDGDEQRGEAEDPASEASGEAGGRLLPGAMPAGSSVPGQCSAAEEASAASTVRTRLR
jgi:hypothetical protein